MKTMIKIWAKIGEVVWKILAVLWILIDVIVGCVTMGLCFVVCTIENCINPCENPYRLCYQVLYTMFKVAMIPVKLVGDSEEEILSDMDEIRQWFGWEDKPSDDYEELKRYAEL